MRTGKYMTVVFVLLALAGCQGSKVDEADNTPQELSVLKVSTNELPVNFEFVGQTVGSVDAEVNARVEGVVTGIHFEEGKQVEEGQLLYTIDPAPYKAKVAEAQGLLAQAQTMLTRAESDLARVKPLVEMKALSERDLDTALAAKGSAEGSVAAAKAAMESAEIELGYCNITAPTTGVIGISKVKVGEFVGRMPNAVILNIVSKLDPIHVQFTVNEKEYLYFARLRQKAIEANLPEQKRPLKLVLADGTEYKHTGLVASIDRNIDASTGSLKLEAAFPNPDQMLRPGQYGKIKAVGEVLSGKIIVPKKVVRELQGIQQVFVVKADNTIELRSIKTSQEIDGQLVVEEGLSQDEVVVAESLARLKSGMLIKPRYS